MSHSRSERYRQVRLSTNATLEQNLRFPRQRSFGEMTSSLPVRYRDAYFFSCQRSRPARLLRIGTSPLPAERSAGLESALRRKTRSQIKNPATSAGRIRPPFWASVPYALGRKCSKLVFFLPGIRNQPHLWISRQARSVSRLPRESGLHQLAR